VRQEDCSCSGREAGAEQDWSRKVARQEDCGCPGREAGAVENFETGVEQDWNPKRRDQKAAEEG
jgi:hypothetical protein